MAAVSKILDHYGVERMFQLFYGDKVPKGEVAEALGVSHSYCHRILIAQRMRHWSVPLYHRWVGGRADTLEPGDRVLIKQLRDLPAEETAEKFDVDPIDVIHIWKEKK